MAPFEECNRTATGARGTDLHAAAGFGGLGWLIRTISGPQPLQRELNFWNEGYNHLKCSHSTIDYRIMICYEQQLITDPAPTSTDP